MNTLKKNSEEAKINYNNGGSGSLSFSGICVDDDDEAIEIEITKEFWNETIKEITDKCKKTVEECLRKANKTKDQIDNVIMIGGTSKIREVSDYVDTVFGKEKRVCGQGVQMQLAVATGACIEAYRKKAMMDAYKLKDDKEMEKFLKQVKEKIKYELKEVCPFPLGIGLYNEQKGHFVSNLIKASQKIPFEKTLTNLGTAKDKQDSAYFPIYQGEEEKQLEKNLITKFIIDNLPILPRGQVKFDLTFSYDSEGLVKVSATVAEPKGIKLDGKAECSFSFKGQDIFKDCRTSSCKCIFDPNRFK